LLSSATVAATAAGFVLGFVHLQWATAEVLAVERLHGFLRVSARHLHEPEAARLTGVAIIDESDFFNGAVGGEQIPHAVFRGAEGQISDIQFGQKKFLGEKSDGRREGLATLCVARSGRLDASMPRLDHASEEKAGFLSRALAKVLDVGIRGRRICTFPANRPAGAATAQI
jgi:hypothetical protein